jgi:hypothetical protein
VLRVITGVGSTGSACSSTAPTANRYRRRIVGWESHLDGLVRKAATEFQDHLFAEIKAFALSSENFALPTRIHLTPVMFELLKMNWPKSHRERWGLSFMGIPLKTDAEKFELT